MRIRHRMLWCAVLAALVVGPGCASSDVEDESDRRARELDDKVVGLQRQVEDQAAVERAQAKELAALKQRNRAAEEKIRALSQEKARLGMRLKELESRPVEQPAALVADKVAVDVSGLSAKGIQVARTEDGEAVLRLAGGQMFPPGSDSLTREGKSRLKPVIRWLKKHRDVLVSVEGHTDATPLGKTKARWGTNLALSLARAMAVHDYLESQGIGKGRMRVVGYGPFKPLIKGTGKAANAKNRRVELVLTRR